MRKEVLEFAEAMEERLKANDYKNGSPWKECDDNYIRSRIQEEYAELMAVLSQKEHALSSTTQNAELFFDEMLKEAADVANFLMMLSDPARLRRG